MSEELQNFTSVVTALAAFGGVTVAAFGLFTWKRQIQWQQGRGLAKSLLVAANEIRTLSRAVRNDFLFHFDDAAPQEVKEGWHRTLQEKVLEFVRVFDEAVNNFEEHSVEARLLWDASFDKTIEEFRDVAHVIRAYLVSGVGSVSPTANPRQRDEAASSHNFFRDDIYGPDAIYSKLNATVQTVESIVKSKLPR